MNRPIHILVVEDESGLAGEVDRAIRGFEQQVFLHVAPTTQAGIAEARSRLPDAICFPMPRDIEALRAAATEFGEVSPSSVLIGILNSSAFDSGDEESAYLIRALRSQVRDFLRHPISSDELAASLRRNLESPTIKAGLGRVASFVSNKGGVGKTTLAVNVATELAMAHPGRVLLIDAALQLALCSTALGLDATSTLLDATDQINRLDATLLRELATHHESGLHLLAGPPDAIQAARVGEGELLRLLGVARRAYDFVVVDTFPVLDSIALAVLDRSDDVFMVLTPTVPTVLGAESLLPVLNSVGVSAKAQHLVLNNALPAHAGRLTIADIETRIQRPIEFVVPFSRRTLRATNTGAPAVVGANRWLGFRSAVRKIAAVLTNSEGVGTPTANPETDGVDGAPAVDRAQRTRRTKSSRATSSRATDSPEPPARIGRRPSRATTAKPVADDSRSIEADEA